LDPCVLSTIAAFLLYFPPICIIFSLIYIVPKFVYRLANKNGLSRIDLLFAFTIPVSIPVFVFIAIPLTNNYSYNITNFVKFVRLLETAILILPFSLLSIVISAVYYGVLRSTKRERLFLALAVVCNLLQICWLYGVRAAL
jgi:hypothetical protein